MVVKVYISGISGNKEVKKRQQRVLMILDSRNIKYEVIDIAEPGNEEQKDFMQNNSTSSGGTISDPNPRHPLPPQIFNDDIYCGDYDQFDLANEVDEMEKFLKLAPDDSAPAQTSNAEIKLGNGELPSAVDEEAKSTEQNGTGDVINNEKQESETNEADKEDINKPENDLNNEQQQEAENEKDGKDGAAEKEDADEQKDNEEE